MKRRGITLLIVGLNSYKTNIHSSAHFYVTVDDWQQLTTDLLVTKLLSECKFGNLVIPTADDAYTEEMASTTTKVAIQKIFPVIWPNGCPLPT